MRRRAAVGVDDDLAAGQAAVAVGAADEELAGGIDVPDRLRRDPALGQRRLDIRADEFGDVLGGEGFDEVLVETTICVASTGLPFWYRTVTWLLASGPSVFSAPEWRAFEIARRIL